MEQEIINIMNAKKIKKGNIPDERIWSHKCSVHPVDLAKVMETQGSSFNYAYSLLFSDNRDIKLNIPIYKRRKINNKKKSNFLKYISDGSEKILNKAYAKINFMKNENKELQKLNTLSLQKTSKSYFRTNRPKTSTLSNSSRNRIENSTTNYQTQTLSLRNSGKFKRNTLQNNLKNLFSKNKIEYSSLTNDKNATNNLYSNENTKENTNPNVNSITRKRNIASAINRNKKNNFLFFNKTKFPFKSNFSLNSPMHSPINLFEDKKEEKYRNLINIDVQKLYSSNRKKKLNLSRLNDIYRVQMNKSLRNYNAENHLKELNKIQRDNISVRQSMENVKFKMNQKINDRCQGQYYKKEYLKFKEENEKDKKARSLEKRTFPVKIPFNIIYEGPKSKDKDFPRGYKERAYYDYLASCERIQKSKDKDLFEFGANLLFGHLHNKDYEYLYDSLDELFNTLETDPIAKYIDIFKNEKPNKDKNILIERLKTYFPVLTETEKKIQKMEQHQIVKRKHWNEEANILEKIQETKKLLNIDK